MSLSQVIELLANGSCKHEDATSLVCMTGDLQGLKYLHRGYPLNPKSFYMAVKHNHMNCVEYLIEQKCLFDTNSYIASIEHIQIFIRLKKLYDNIEYLDKYPGIYIRDKNSYGIYDNEFLKLIIEKNRLDILKLYTNKDTEYTDLYDQTSGYDILKKILKHKRTEMLNWCYESRTMLGNIICRYFPVNGSSMCDCFISYYSENEDQENLKFFIDWFQTRDKKKGDTMKLFSYSELIYTYLPTDNILLLCNTYQECKIPIDANILQIFDNDKIAMENNTFRDPRLTYNVFRDPRITYNYDKVIPIIEWLVDHDVKIHMVLINFWALDVNYHPWIGVVCKKKSSMIIKIVKYCINWNNVHLLTYLHSVDIKLPLNICAQAVHNNSINVLNWGIFMSFYFNCTICAEIAIDKGFLDILKVCYELGYKITNNDIIKHIDLDNKEMVIWMISVCDDLEKTIFHIIERDNIKYFILLPARKIFPGNSGFKLTAPFCCLLKKHIARYNSKKICKRLLENTHWYQFITEKQNMLYHNTFHYTAIEYGNIEVLKIVGLHPPTFCKNKYYTDLITHALKHQKYDIVKWINAFKLKFNKPMDL
jgi:hypothetical protein